MKAQEFLATNDVEHKSMDSASKIKYQASDLKELLKDINVMYAARGKKVVKFDLRKEYDDELMATMVFGPTGNFRAPAIRKGKTLVVGFNQELYDEHFGS